MGPVSEEELEWPPPAARLRAALWRAESHLERREYAAASRALAEVFELVGADERELLHGLHHLAAAGYKGQTGHPTRGRRQLAHARRRLAAYCPTHRELDLTTLLDRVERDLGS